jgi:hypothetical protein
MPDFDGDWHDAGGGHQYLFLVAEAADYPEAPELLQATLDDEGLIVVGIIDNHRKADGTSCSGSVAFLAVDGRPTWTVQSLDPLDLTPSLLCNPTKGGCASHGWYRAGRWVEA